MAQHAGLVFRSFANLYGEEGVKILSGCRSFIRPAPISLSVISYMARMRRLQRAPAVGSKQLALGLNASTRHQRSVYKRH